MRALALSLACMSVGCLQAPQYACNSDAVCVLNNVNGTCDLPTNTCVYTAPECPSMLRDGHGNCFDSGMASTDDPTADESATASMSGSPTTSDPDETTSASEMTADASGPEPTTTGANDCDVEGDDITHLGVVGASSVFAGFPPIRARDGDVTTSWFSTGPEMGPTVYTWVLSNPSCVARIELTGNGMHSNPAFREGFGFEAVTVKLLDQANAIVFSEPLSLAGTPDPDVRVETGGVRASRLHLEFTGHENVDCGGFSELRVYGE